MSAKLVGSSVVRFFALMQLSFALYWVVGTALSGWPGFAWRACPRLGFLSLAGSCA